MLKRPSVKKLSPEAIQAITTASASQTAKRSVVKSIDPNFPVFDIPVNAKVLVYVPNHTIQTEDGVAILREDKFAAHNVLDGKFNARVRCTNGIVSDELDLDGSCPFCDASHEAWDLYNFEYRQLCASKLLDPDAEGTYEQVKSDAIALRDKKAIGSTVVYHTFPIVVVECQKKPDGTMTTTPAVDGNGSPIHKVCWYTISDSLFEDRWVKSLDSIDSDEPVTSPAGRWFVLNYEYKSESGTHNKMMSAQKLQVSCKAMSEKWQEVEAYFDKITEEWTPAKAIETLVDNAFRSGEEQMEACNEIMKGTRERLAQIKVASLTTTAPQGSLSDTEDALASYKATPVGIETAQGIASADAVGVEPEVPQTPLV